MFVDTRFSRFAEYSTMQIPVFRSAEKKDTQTAPRKHWASRIAENEQETRSHNAQYFSEVRISSTGTWKT
jgi:hypothetical protein